MATAVIGLLSTPAWVAQAAEVSMATEEVTPEEVITLPNPSPAMQVVADRQAIEVRVTAASVGLDHSEQKPDRHEAEAIPAGAAVVEVSAGANQSAAVVGVVDPAAPPLLSPTIQKDVVAHETALICTAPSTAASSAHVPPLRVQVAPFGVPAATQNGADPLATQEMATRAVALIGVVLAQAPGTPLVQVLLHTLPLAPSTSSHTFVVVPVETQETAVMCGLDASTGAWAAQVGVLPE